MSDEAAARPATTELALAAAALRKSYPSGHTRLVVLDGLELEVGRAELLAIVGASGTGKSTLLHILGGLDRPDSGSVLYAGRDVFALDRRARAAFRNREVGFVFQFHYLLAEFDALENVMMPGLIGGGSRSALAIQARALLSEVGLAERAHHHPDELSGGEQQRVAIARALITEPTVVLADEPTGNLDQSTGEQVFAMLAERVRSRALTAVVVTHNEQLARRADRVIRLATGRLSPVNY